MVRSSTNIRDYRTKKEVRAEFTISLYTEDGIFNASETALCNLSDLYRCSKRYSLSCYKIFIYYSLKIIQLTFNYLIKPLYGECFIHISYCYIHLFKSYV